MLKKNRLGEERVRYRIGHLKREKFVLLVPPTAVEGTVAVAVTVERVAISPSAVSPTPLVIVTLVSSKSRWIQRGHAARDSLNGRVVTGDELCLSLKDGDGGKEG